MTIIILGIIGVSSAIQVLSFSVLGSKPEISGNISLDICLLEANVVNGDLLLHPM